MLKKARSVSYSVPMSISLRHRKYGLLPKSDNFMLIILSCLSMYTWCNTRDAPGGEKITNSRFQWSHLYVFLQNSAFKQPYFFIHASKITQYVQSKILCSYLVFDNVCQQLSLLSFLRKRTRIFLFNYEGVYFLIFISKHPKVHAKTLV